MKKFLLCFALCLVMAGACFAAEETMKVFVGATELGKPYVFKNKDGNADGFEGDMWREIARRANFDVEFKYNSFAALFGLLDNGEIDLIAHFIGRTPARLEKYAFSDVYSYAALRLVLKNGTEPVTEVQQLWGKTVGVEVGTASAGVLKRLDPDGKIDIRVYDNGKMIPREVEMGRIFALLDNSVAMSGELKAMGVDCVINPWILHATEVAYPYSRGRERSEQIMARVNRALAEMLADGTIKGFSEKWFSLDTTVSE